MKKTLSVIAAIAALAFLVVVISPRASDFTPAQASGTVNATLISTTANATSAGTFVEIASHHTFQLTCTVGFNTNFNVFLDRSLDNVNWVTFYTNVVVANITNDTTLVGHWSYVRARTTGASNTMATAVLYLGGN